MRRELKKSCERSKLAKCLVRKGAQKRCLVCKGCAKGAGCAKAFFFFFFGGFQHGNANISECALQNPGLENVCNSNVEAMLLL